MTNIRRRHSASFTIISNRPIEDAELDWETLGLLAYLRSRPDNWQVKVRQLIALRKGGRDRMHRMLRQLEDRCYISREILRNDAGRIVGMEYLIDDDKVRDGIDGTSQGGGTASVLSGPGKHGPIISTEREQKPSLYSPKSRRPVGADLEREWKSVLSFWQPRRAAYSQSRPESVDKAKRVWDTLSAEQRRHASAMMPGYFDALNQLGRSFSMSLATFLRDKVCELEHAPLLAHRPQAAGGAEIPAGVPPFGSSPASNRMRAGSARNRTSDGL